MKKYSFILFLFAILTVAVQAQPQIVPMKIAKFNPAYPPVLQTQYYSFIGEMSASRVDTTEWQNLPNDTLGFSGYITSPNADSTQLNIYVQWGLPFGPDTTAAVVPWLPGGGTLVLWQTLGTSVLSYGQTFAIPWWLKPAGVTRFRYIITFGASKIGVDGDATRAGLQPQTYETGYSYIQRVR